MHEHAHAVRHLGAAELVDAAQIRLADLVARHRKLHARALAFGGARREREESRPRPSRPPCARPPRPQRGSASSAASMSTTTLERTPRESWWPMPMMRKAGARVRSPASAWAMKQVILLDPTSSAAINPWRPVLLFLVAQLPPFPSRFPARARRELRRIVGHANNPTILEAQDRSSSRRATEARIHGRASSSSESAASMFSAGRATVMPLSSARFQRRSPTRTAAVTRDSSAGKRASTLEEIGCASSQRPRRRREESA